MLPRTLLKYRVAMGLMRPFFMDTTNVEHKALAGRALAFFDANVGKRKGEVDLKELYYAVGDDRLGAGLARAAEHIYAYSPALDGLPRLRRSPLELRLRLFRLVGSRPPGFAEESEGFLRALLEQDPALEGVKPEALEAYMWSDDPRGFRLVKERASAGPADLIRFYNFEVMDTILANSKAVTFSTDGSGKVSKGAFAKEVCRKVRELGLLYEGALKGGRVFIEVHGPVSLFGRPTRFAWRLSALFYRALPVLEASGEWAVEVKVAMGRRELTCRLTAASLPEFEADIREAEEVKPMFDSRVERKFYNVMATISKFKTYREAEPLIFKDTLVVPDFTFERPDGSKWHLEIIGFWRPEYTAKKRAKLMELRRAGFDRLILLVDREYEKYFRGVGFPTFAYRLKGDRLEAPYGSIVRLLTS